jgi:hypothetical protein
MKKRAVPVDAYLFAPLMTYTITSGDGNTEIEAGSFEEAREEAEDWINAGWDHSDDEGNTYIDVHLKREDGEEDSFTVIFEQEEPTCRKSIWGNGEHSWYEKGTWGRGGGTVTVEHCEYCDMKRTTDTWATRPDTGEQGFTEVKYTNRSGIY